MTTLTAARAELQRAAVPAKAAAFKRFLKNSGDDLFLGVTTARIRVVAQNHSNLPLTAVRTLMRSNVHDERSLAHAILVLKFQTADDAGQTRIFDFYMKNRGFIRQWDGVDDSAPCIVGPYLQNRDKAILYELVHSESLWDRRIALVSNLPDIRRGVVADTLKLAKAVLADREDLIHKAAGWMLREVGKKNLAALHKFLSEHSSKMPRTMLRYAIERLSPSERAQYMKRERNDARPPRLPTPGKASSSRVATLFL